MDSKIVTREIRREIWPALKQAGFAYFTGKKAWRHSANKIDVVNFQSFNSYLADSVGCTTLSFALNLGCYLTCIPWPTRWPKKDPLLPQEYLCHFRHDLKKSIKQSELERKSIWLIKENGEYLPEAIADAKSLLLQEGLPWFDLFVDQKSLLPGMIDEDQFWEAGAKASPRRNYLTGYLALALSERELAAERLSLALQSGCYNFEENELREVLAALNAAIF